MSLKEAWTPVRDALSHHRKDTGSLRTQETFSSLVTTSVRHSLNKQLAATSVGSEQGAPLCQEQGRRAQVARLE